VDRAADNAAVGRAALAKATARLIPFLFLLYIVAFLDRVIVGFAALQMTAITIAAFGIYSTLATFWSLPTAFLSGTAAAAGIALINSVGNLGGFVGPYVVGYLSDATGGFYAGLLLLAALILIAGLLALAVRHERSLEQVEEVVAPIAGTPTSG
jgi:nitrate/nitrite transporter NarK